MLFGWNVEQGITSNSVIYVKDGVTVGIGKENRTVLVSQRSLFLRPTQKYADACCFKKYGSLTRPLSLKLPRGKGTLLRCVR